MKKIIEINEGEGFEALLGEKVLIFCLNYIYAGTLSGVNETCIQLENAQIVYETGVFSSDTLKDAQDLPTSTWYIQTGVIESFGKQK